MKSQIATLIRVDGKNYKKTAGSFFGSPFVIHEGVSDEEAKFFIKELKMIRRNSKGWKK